MVRMNWQISTLMGSLTSVVWLCIELVFSDASSLIVLKVFWSMYVFVYLDLETDRRSKRCDALMLISVSVWSLSNITVMSSLTVLHVVADKKVHVQLDFW